MLDYGLIYFTPNEGNFVKGQPCYGKGSYKYAEGSIYTGDLFYDGMNYNKIGKGQQDFTNCEPQFHTINGKLQRYYVYIGNFDYRKTDWIYGNGVLYFVDENNNPSGFQIGFFSGLEKIMNYKGKFDYKSLLPGYDKKMEIKKIKNSDLKKESFLSYVSTLLNIDKNYDALFVGDSYFDYLRNYNFTGINFDKEFPNIKYLNLAVGGTTCKDWINYWKHINLKYNPTNIFLNLGFNDTHSGTFGKELIKTYVKTIKILTKMFPKSNIYIFTICHAPLYTNHYNKEEDFNNFLKSYNFGKNVKLIDLSDEIAKSADKCFCNDNVHLSNAGYKILYREFHQII